MIIEKPVDIERHKIVYDGCMIAYSGEIINLLRPEENVYRIEDIAHGLAMTCRWNGATKVYYSVAEHCCFMHDLFISKGEVELAKTALFHDCEEAYWGDIIKPLKNLLSSEIRYSMDLTRSTIFKVFGVQDINDQIEAMDFHLLQWDFDNVIMSRSHQSWDCYVAEREWLNRYNSIQTITAPNLERSVATDLQSEKENPTNKE